MDERDLRHAFHAAFDERRPGAGAVDRAFAEVADHQTGKYTLGRRLAGAAAVALTLLVVATLLIARGALSAHHATVPAGRPIATPPAAPPPAQTPPGEAPASANQPPAALVTALNDRVVLAGWAGTGQLELTVDGGATWTGLRVPQGNLFDLQWVDGDLILASTDAGLFAYRRSTSDWARLSARSDLVRVDFRDRSLGYAVTAAGDVVETRDGGTTLSTIDVGLHPVTWLQWVSATHAWAAGPAGVTATSDSGATWKPQLTVPAGRDQPGGVMRAQVGFRDEMNGFAVFAYDAGAATGYAVYHSADGGATWTAQSCTCGQGTVPGWLGAGPLPALPEPRSDLVVTGGSSAMLVADDPKAGAPSICGSTDAGRTWSCDPVPFDGGAAALAVRGQVRWLVGRAGSAGQLLASSQDGGATWTVRRP